MESTNRTHSVCSCNHLTNFAILMDVVDEHQHSLFTMFDGNMRIFIYISIAICVVFIVIALLTLKLFNGVFVKVRNATSPTLPHQRAGSRRQQNNIRDQTHESLTLTTPSSQTNASAPSHGNTNFIQHNSIRNSHRNNLNYNVQQQQQQQQVVAAAAAAVVLSNQPQRNMQHAMNNLNLNLHQHGQQTAAAAAAAASIAAALQQHAVQATSNNLNISHNYLQARQQQQQQLGQQQQQHPLGNHNLNLEGNGLDNNTNNIIMQANMDDLQYKWWWW